MPSSPLHRGRPPAGRRHHQIQQNRGGEGEGSTAQHSGEGGWLGPRYSIHTQRERRLLDTPGSVVGAAGLDNESEESEKSGSSRSSSSRSLLGEV
ncbi:hypothetical protein NL676_026546 [Syzygium grande]|nr:hypothetical protein NL676_026546 [Syzygium grande]